MKKHGLRIGNIGIEFPSVVDRDKALKAFTQGTDVEISDKGLRYMDGKGSFSIYDRDTKEITSNCCKCYGVFLLESCSKREYPEKESWRDSYKNKTGYICDACLASAEKAKKLFDAKKLVENEEE